ncbi:MAG: winged helix-turn-helix transcriptional regulator [Candidatus Brocadiia bacterium]
MSRFAELQRRLAALAEIASDGTITQRSLASKLEVSLGLANALLRGLESERLIKSGGTRAKETARYAITRAGRGAMQRMSRAFAAEAAALLRKSLGSKAKVARLLSARRPAEATRGR